MKHLHKLNHLAIIPDGNRRWAKKRSLQPWLGHEQGTSSLQQLFETAIHHDVHYVTFWGASMDNLVKRSKREVEFLLKIIGTALSRQNLHDFLHQHHVQVKFLGEWKTLLKDEKLKIVFRDLEEKTKHYTKNFLTILFAYDGKREMLQAIQKTAAQSTSDLTEENFRKLLITGTLPDVDMVIRTGGQPHWSSGFMMWLTANSQFYFTQTLWPDFKPLELKKALQEYNRRERKMGT